MTDPEGRVPAQPPNGQEAEAARGGHLFRAALRPLNIIVLVVGAVAFATTLIWWFVPLTIVTYVLLVYLAARELSLGEGDTAGGRKPIPPAAPEVSPERRARWLPRGETRQKVESALIVYRKLVASIEDADDVTRAVLDGAVPKLHAAADRLVDVGLMRERAAEAASNLPLPTDPQPQHPDDEDRRGLEEVVRAADEEISATTEGLNALQAKVVRASIDSNNPARAADVSLSLDDLNARLEALSQIMGPPPEGGGPARSG